MSKSNELFSFLLSSISFSIDFISSSFWWSEWILWLTSIFSSFLESKSSPSLSFSSLISTSNSSLISSRLLSLISTLFLLTSFISFSFGDSWLCSIDFSWFIFSLFSSRLSESLKFKAKLSKNLAVSLCFIDSLDSPAFSSFLSCSWLIVSFCSFCRLLLPFWLVSLLSIFPFACSFIVDSNLWSESPLFWSGKSLLSDLWAEPWLVMKSLLAAGCSLLSLSVILFGGWPLFDVFKISFAWEFWRLIWLEFPVSMKSSLIVISWLVNELDFCLEMLAFTRSILDVFKISFVWEFWRLTWLEFPVSMKSSLIVISWLVNELDFCFEIASLTWLFLDASNISLNREFWLLILLLLFINWLLNLGFILRFLFLGERLMLLALGSMFLGEFSGSVESDFWDEFLLFQ